MTNDNPNNPAPEASTPEILRPPFKRSAESERLERLLSELEIGTVVTYAQLRELIGEDPRAGVGYNLVRAVRERLIRERIAVWFTLAGVGLKRGSPTEILELASSGLVSVRRKNQRTQQVLTNADFAQLTSEERRDFNWLATTLGTLRLFLSRPVQKKLQDLTQEVQLEPEKVLRLFGGEGK
jgi:hypothetical protein